MPKYLPRARASRYLKKTTKTQIKLECVLQRLSTAATIVVELELDLKNVMFTDGFPTFGSNN